jgi:hypothetical protein
MFIYVVNNNEFRIAGSVRDCNLTVENEKFPLFSARRCYNAKQEERLQQKRRMIGF